MANNGKLFQTEFIADELGYRPVGEHIHPAFVQVDHQLASLIVLALARISSLPDGEAGQAVGGEEERGVPGAKASWSSWSSWSGWSGWSSWSKERRS